MGAALAVTISVAAMAGPWAARAQVADTSQTVASAEITDPVSITVTQNLTFTIQTTAVKTILNTGLTILPATFISGAGNGANAQVVVFDAGNALSVAVPASIDVTRDGGVETISVRTVASTGSLLGADSGPVTGVLSGGAFTGPVTVTGVLDDGILSFSVGGAVTLADSLVPGNYQGVLTVVAQYN
jgi:hypothetical protein